MKLFALAALSLGTVTAPAALATPVQFDHDGQRYTYSTRDVAGARVIRGVRDDGVRYRYVLRDGKVTGRVDGERVAFDVRDAAGAAD